MTIDHLFIFSNRQGEEANELISFVSGEQLGLVLAFDHCLQGKEEELKHLNLTIKY